MSELMAAPYIEPIRKSILVKATPERAFEVFTAGIARWWLPGSSIHPDRVAIDKVIIEPKAGGRWYERAVDGSETDWGRVLAWEPPKRLLVDWQISADGRFDPGLHTEVEIRFTAQGRDSTLVTLEHRHFERLGSQAAHTRTRRDAGWAKLLDAYAAHFSDR